MPPLALLAIGGLATNAIGSTLSARAAGKTNVTRVPVAPPKPVNPEIASLYNTLATGVGKDAFAGLSSMMKDGMPTDVGPAFEAMLAAKERFVGQGRENIAEMFGNSGLRYSSSLMNGLQDFETQTNKDSMQILADYTFRAQESARARQMGAIGLGADIFSGPGQHYYNPEVVMGSQGTSPAGAAFSTLGSGLFSLGLLQAGGFFGGKG